MINTISIDGTDIYEEYGLILATKNIGFPSVQKKLIEVPMRDGSLDYTEVLSDCVRYNNRSIDVSFLYLGNNFTDVYFRFSKKFHGQKCKMIFSDDANFYYYGRIEVESIERVNHGGKINIKCDCDPYKYDIVASDAEWLWDPFDFEDGIINSLGEITVNGSQEATLICRKKREFPEFTASAQLEMVFGGETYIIPKGKNKLYNVFFVEGENKMTFKGNGKVSIHYIGGEI